jgi:hypothetical protein
MIFAMQFPSYRRLAVIGSSLAVGIAAFAIPASASAAPLPGTTVGDYCTSYKHIPFSASSPSQDIDYRSCNDGTTVKFVTFTSKGGENFQYVEFRDALGNLTESRFGYDPDASNPAVPAHIVPLADSVSP